MFPPAPEHIQKFLRAVTATNPGIGLLDTRTGRLYLCVASALADGDHASLVEQELGIVEADDAAHLRGFVIGLDGNSWRFVNNSGLNPMNNRMEPELFDELQAVLTSAMNRFR